MIDVQNKEVRSVCDGLRISYQVLGCATDRTIVLANGLGGRLYAWKPLVERFADCYRLLTWDYRGLFQSDSPPRIRKLSIANHAEDLKSILDQEGVKTAAGVGWSMGVQVLLEFTSLYPERVERLVLMNGTYGHALSTAFQPVAPIPYVNRILHEYLEFLRAHPRIVTLMSRLLSHEPAVRAMGRLYSRIRGNPVFPDLAWQYVKDVFGDDKFLNYLRLFQELDGHSVYHHLREIDRPTLVICGLMDILTPAYLSFEMIRKLSNVESLILPLGTHFVLVEYPDRVLGRIEEFLEP